MAEETPLEAGKKPSLLDNLLGAPAKALNQVLNQTTGFYPTVMRVANAESIGDVAEAVGLPAYEEGPEKRNIEKAPKTIEFDANGLFNELVNEAGMSREGAAQDVKQALLGVMAEEKAFLNLTDEDLEQLSNDYGPEELLLMFTDTRDRSSMEAFGEGAAREAVLSPVSLKPGVMVGIKAFKATPGPLPVKLLSGIGAGLVTAATVRGLTEAAMDKTLENTRFANDPFLPEDTSMFEAGRAFSEVATGGAVLRSYLAKIPSKAVDEAVELSKLINPLMAKVSNSVRGGLRRFGRNLTNSLAESAQATSGRTLLNPKLTTLPSGYTRQDLIAAGLVGVGTEIAERRAPGDLMTRMGTQVVSGLLGAGSSLVRALGGVGSSGLKNLTLLLPDNIPFTKTPIPGVRGAKDLATQKEILKTLSKGEGFDLDTLMKDLDVSIKDLKEYGDGPTPLSPGFLTGNNQLRALENYLGSASPEFKALLEEQGTGRAEMLTAIIRALYETGDENAIKVATEAYTGRFSGLLQASLNNAANKLNSSVNAVKGATSGKYVDEEAAAKVFEEEIRKTFEAAESVVDNLWGRVDKRAKVEVNSAAKVINDAFLKDEGYLVKSMFQNKGNWNSGAFDKKGVVPILERIEIENAINKQIAESGEGAEGFVKMTLNEMKNYRSSLLNMLKGTTDPAQQKFIGNLANGLLEDMYAAVLPDAKSSVNFLKARAASSAVKDAENTIFGQLGESTVPFQLGLGRALPGGNKGRYYFDEITEASTLLKSLREIDGPAVKGPVVISGLSPTDKPKTTTFKAVERSMGASIEDVASGFLSYSINKHKVLVPVTRETPVLPGQVPQKVQSVEVDTQALDNFLSDPLVDKLLTLPPFRSLGEDLVDASTNTRLLTEGLETFERIAKNNSATNAVLKTAVGMNSPQRAISSTLDSKANLDQFEALVKLISRAQKDRPDDKINEAFMSALTDTLFDRAQNSGTSIKGRTLKALFEEPIIHINQAGKGKMIPVSGKNTSIKDLLLEQGIVDESYFKSLNKVFEDFNYLDGYLKQVLDPKESGKDRNLDFLARVGGARAAPKGTIQVPAEFAKRFVEIFEALPRTLLAARLKEALKPGNVEEFRRIIGLGAEKGANYSKIVASNFANYFKTAGVVVPASVSSAEASRAIAEVPFPQRKPIIEPVRTKRKPAPVLPERKPVDTSSLISPRTPITQPPSKQAAAVDLSGPFNPETYARLFPNDGVVT
jgi:hypothetical protein